MSWLPFICLGAGFFIGTIVKGEKFTQAMDRVFTLALAMLMVCIGLGMGIDETVLGNIFKIGLDCVAIALCAILGSVAFTVLCEKTVLPLKQVDAELGKRDVQWSNDAAGDKKKGTPLVWIMPICIVLGIAAGIVFRETLPYGLVNGAITLFLVILYICVGVSQAANKEVFQFIRLLGGKVVFLSVAILVGSLTGGYVAGALLGIPKHVSILSAGGMSYYSITGAFMTEAYGLEVGAYGFLVNVMREFITIVSMPLLVKISLGSPIAGGAAGNMDTMLAPVTKFVGVRLGLVTLVTGTILTFVVPFLLPLLAALF